MYITRCIIKGLHCSCCEHVLLRWCSGEVKRQVSVFECHAVFWVHVDTYSSKLVEVGSQLTQPVRIYHSNIPHKVFGGLDNLIEHNPEMLFCLRNRSALAVNCCVIIHCLEVSDLSSDNLNNSC